MLNLCFDFGYENDLVYNTKKLVSFAIGELFKGASGAEMFIGEGKIEWNEACCYLGVNNAVESIFVLIVMQLLVLFLINLHCLKNVTYTFREHNVFQC